jgi:hydroxymethylbilane synthase
MTKITIGTRGSQLALWQAHYTREVLEKHGYQVELNIISTKGDRTQQWNLSFDKIEGKGFFTKEIEDALLNREADLAVHSCKDLPTEDTPGLKIAAYSYRANPYDVLLIHPSAVDATQLIPLKTGAITGTSSARRKSQILLHRPDLQVQDLRGNVPTRIQKLRDGQYDAIILASAGIERLELDLSDLLVYPLSAPLYIPAPAQGVLAYQIRKDDEAMQEVCRLLHDEAAYQAICLERSVLREFQGGCQVPLGVYAEKSPSGMHIWISKASSWDAPVWRSYQFIEDTLVQAKDLVDRFNAMKATKVFISRDLSERDFFYRILHRAGFALEARSLVDIQPLDFELTVQPDWLFFTSKNGVRHFFDRISFSPDDTPKIGAINAGTAAAIKALGMEVAFQGMVSDTRQVAEAFAEQAEGLIVLPQAQNSRKVIESALPEAISLSVYSNQPIQVVPATDAKILVFTSPLNAEVYLKQHILQSGQNIVAIGSPTAVAIRQLGYTCVEAYDPMPWSLADVVMQLSAQL